MLTRSFKLLVLVLVSIGHLCHAYNLLGLFPYPGKSHHDVFKPLLIELANRGHNVTALSFFPLENPPANYHDFSLVGLTDAAVEIIDLKNFESCLFGYHRFKRAWDAMTPLHERALIVCDKLFQWPSVIELIQLSNSSKFDGVIMEGFNSDCMLAFAHQFGVPVITLSSCPMVHWAGPRFGVSGEPSYFPTNGMTLADGDDLSLWQRFQNIFFLTYYKQWYRYEIQAKEEAILKREFGQYFDLDSLSRKSVMLLINVHHSLNGVRPLPPGVIEVGGMHLKKTVDPLPHELEAFINTSEDVILFSFGSMMRSSTMSDHIRNIFIKVFSKFPIRVIWKWESGSIPGAGDNILATKWIPQFDLLRHPKVVAMIGHAGLLSLTEAVDAGKPMLAVPFYGDQPTNAARAAKRGVAVLLEYCEITEESLTDALTRILSPRMRDNAKKLSRIWQDRPMKPLEEALYWVERVVRTGNDAQLIPYSRDIPFYKKAMLDVYGVTVAVLILILFIVYLCIRGLLGYIFRLLSGKEREIKIKTG